MEYLNEFQTAIEGSLKDRSKVNKHRKNER
jgi:hypothetical protein